MTWQKQFLDRYLVLEPEEARSLGAEVPSGAQRDMSPAGRRSRRALYDETRAAIAAAGAPQSMGESLDRRIVLRHGAWEAFAEREGLHLRNISWAGLPYTTMQYAAAFRSLVGDDSESFKEDLEAYAAQVPRFLSDLEAGLREGQAEGLVAHENHIRLTLQHDLPVAMRYFSRVSAEAEQAYVAFAAFLQNDLLPQAPRENLLGEGRYREGLALTHALDDDLDELLREARTTLEEIQQEMIATLRSIEPGRDLSDFAAVARRMSEIQSLPFEEGFDVRAHYRGIMRGCMEYMSEVGEFGSIDVDDIGMNDYPEGMRDRGPGSNWPAPLLRQSAQGQFVIHPDTKAHSPAWASVLAIHEGVPGHFLQSQGFRRAFGGGEVPVRFLCVADDIAIPRLNFLSMLSIEGYAVYAEERVRLSGFHEGYDQLFALAAHALRAVRLIAEAELHCGAATATEVKDFVKQNAGLPSADWEIERYLRGPFQAPSYYLGAREFQLLREKAERVRQGNFEAATFHEELFAFGPATPRDMGEALFPEETGPRSELR